MSDLRTRIAEALYGQIINPVPPFSEQPGDVQAAWLADADAVIRELGLKKENVGTIHRYITDWKDS
jgi:hypothetical protein